MSDIKRRIDRLERDTGNGRPVVVVNWDSDPKPPEPGVIVVTWEDDHEPKQAD